MRSRRRTAAPDTVLGAAGPGLARVRAVREAIGATARLLVDCHCRFTAATAPPIAEELARLGVGWFEEPVQPRTAAADLATIARRVRMPVAGGESGYGRDFFDELLDRGAVAVIMPDIKHCGGVAEAVRAGRSALGRGGGFSLHSPSGPVSLLAGAHVTAAVPDALPLEHAVDEVDWRADLIDPAERIEAGRLLLPPVPASAPPSTGAPFSVTAGPGHLERPFREPKKLGFVPWIEDQKSAARGELTAPKMRHVAHEVSALGHEAQQSGIHGERLDLIERNPPECQRFGRHREGIGVPRLEQEADVVVIVGGDAAAGSGAAVDVEIDDVVQQWSHREARLLGRLPARDRKRIRVAVGVAAELQPPADLGVVGQQHARRGAVDHQGGAGDVTVVPAVALEAARLAQHEAAEAGLVLVGVAGLVAVERGEQPFAVQGAAQATAGTARPSRSKIGGNVWRRCERVAASM